MLTNCDINLLRFAFSSCNPPTMPGMKTPSRPQNAPFKVTSAAKGFKEPRDDCGRSLNKVLVRVDYQMRKRGLY